MPKYVNMLKNATYISNKIINIFIFFASLRTDLCESSIYTRDILRDSHIVKNYFRGFGPDVTLSVSYGPYPGLELIPTELPS